MAVNIQAYYFSPTGTTEKVVRRIADGLANRCGCFEKPHVVNFTDYKERQGDMPIVIKDSVLIVGVPVYAGRVPNVLLSYLKRFKGENSQVVLIVLYGNRAYDDALIELREIFIKVGFTVVGAGAFIGEHAFSKVLAAGRPDAEDCLKADTLVEQISLNLKNFKSNENRDNASLLGSIAGEVALRPYYRPLDKDGNPFDFKTIKPVTLDSCVHCGICAAACPVQSIDYIDHKTILGKCIKCCACVKRCPTHAKVFDDPNFIKHKIELECQCVERQEPELFLSF